ncbi:MAG TPA: hypothetical protein VMB51_16415 [Solirubrobacteraceae bacterium]|nr:hypothetical protein [Solirubrobacteraceae bacterium]
MSGPWRHPSGRRARSPLLLLAFAVLAGGAFALLGLTATAQAAGGPWWHLESRAAPSDLAPGGEGRIIVSASDVGTTQADGETEPITISDGLPPRLKATAISGGGSYPEEQPPMSCSLESLSCTYTGSVLPYKRLEVTIQVKVEAGAPTQEQNTVSVKGGGAPTPAPLTRPVAISPAATPFGVENYQLTPEEEGGTVDTQAGSHPFQLTATFDLNQTLAPGRFGEGLDPQLPALPRNLSFKLPPGLVGNPTAAPRCSEVQFATIGQDGFTNLCPAETAVGVAVVTIYEPVLLSFSTITVPLFNLTPAQGEPARFGFEVFKVPVILDTAVRSGEGYAVSVSVSNASQAAAILGSQVTFWGQPAAEAHDHARGWACLDLPFLPERASLENCPVPAQHSSAAFLTLPTSCTGQPLKSSVEGVSWPTSQASEGGPLQAFASFGPLTGCESLPFDPAISTEPDQHTANTPSGLTVAVHLPQASTVEGDSLAEAAVNATTVTLPEDVLLNPAAAGGLAACTGGEVGLVPGIEERLQLSNSVFAETPWSCPQAAKVGTVRIKTPLLDHELEGAVYLASQDTNPFSTPLVLYLLVHDPVSGVQVKLAGSVSPNPLTGQLTSTFQNTPQLPFEELTLHFFDGPRASLSTPATCGSYQTQASLTPWSGTPPAAVASSFEVSSGAEGSLCTSPPLFEPAFDAQSANTQAGAFTPFTLSLKRPDQDQPLAGMSVLLPRGVAAILASVTPCPEPQAARGACGPQSLIGHTTAASGLGPEPFTLPGSVYLTGPYHGAPFGLSIVTPALAGPFNLGTVIVRAAIQVNPTTAQVTVTSSIPTSVETASAGNTGIPTQLKELAVTIDRPGFEFNPTNCDLTRIESVLTGAEGASTRVSSPFQVTGCQNLPFKPAVNAQTQGQTSKADGASLALKFTSHTGEAHVARTILTIPATLPARLTTIQKACIAATFEANPASCPEGSVIGIATVHTPALKGPLTGPIYLVSHGNAAWPDAELVLQGEGITIILDGQTAIKKGVTTSSFLSVPDAPFESVEATLPEGPHSALTTNLPLKDHYSLCGQRLAIPAQLTGQNGSAINDDVAVRVQGCHAVKASRSTRLTREQKLRRALEACRRRHQRSRSRRRQACERTARARYRPSKPARRR